jgi:hypothetical protein
MKILVFLHGTTLMHQSAVGRTREERVRQVVERETSVHDFASYVPAGDAVRKLRTWERQSATILYLSSHRSLTDVEKDRSVLRQHGFPAGPVLYRQAGEGYKDIAERFLPDVLIEDDCESIGGEQQMVYPHITAGLKDRIRSIIVQEFGGLDHLPDDLDALRSE